MNKTEIFIGFGIGLLTSGLVAWITVIIQNKIRRERMKKMFGKAEGKFECWGFEPINTNISTADPSNYKRTLEKNPNGSIAEISYQEENRLSIKLTPNNGPRL